MERSVIPRDPNLKFETSDYKVVVGKVADNAVPDIFAKTYYIIHKQDGVVAGHGPQLPGMIHAAVNLQQALDEILSQGVQGPPEGRSN